MKRSYRDYGAAFAKILVPLRERKGVTQEQLARRSKVPLRTIRLYERGPRRGGPFITDLAMIATALDVDPVNGMLEPLLREVER